MQGKLKILIIFSILMICSSGKIVYGYTGTGTEKDPYVVTKEWELKEIMTQKSKGDSWVYIAVNDEITITNTITVDGGKFRIYARGSGRTIKRSTDINAPINNKNPKYCMKIMGNAQVVFGYDMNKHILKLGGNKDNISKTHKTSGWLNIDSAASVTIDKNCHVTKVRNNESEASGAPIRAEGKITINGEISDCEGVNGGAVKAYSGEVLVNSNAKIHDCVSQTEGGAIHISAGGKLTMEGGKVYECISEEEGGAVFISGNSRGDILGGEIYANVSGKSAGGIFSGYGATLVIGTLSGRGPEIYSNKAAGSGGGVRCNGGITETAGGTTYFYGGVISQNYSGKNGGGISCGAPGKRGSSKIIIQNTDVIRNICESTAGGIWLPAEAKGINTDYVILDRCEIKGNESKQSTGGIMVHCNVKATNNDISNNSCKDSGGGVYIDNGGCFTLYSGIVEGNKSGAKGEGVYVKGEFKIISEAYVDSNNKVYLKKGTYIEVIGKLNKTSGYIAIIDSEEKANGTGLVKVGYGGSDATKELYYSGTPADEYIPKLVSKKYRCYGLKDNKYLRPGNNVNGYDDRWIIISEKYTITFDKNCGEKVENLPAAQIKFWNENIVISDNQITREGCKTDENKHWNLNKDGSGTCIMPGSIYTSNDNKTIYAIWIKAKISELFISAEDRYYAVSQNIILDNNEILKKVYIEDDLKTGKKYDAKIVEISKDIDEIIAKGSQLSAEQYMDTSEAGKYKVTVYVKEDDVEKTQAFNVYVLDTFLQNGKTRFISSLYLDTLSRMSKWYGILNIQLRTSLQKNKGEGLYIINLSKEKIGQIKQTVKRNGYKINQAMNKELAESW